MEIKIIKRISMLFIFCILLNYSANANSCKGLGLRYTNLNHLGVLGVDYLFVFGGSTIQDSSDVFRARKSLLAISTGIDFLSTKQKFFGQHVSLQYDFGWSKRKKGFHKTPVPYFFSIGGSLNNVSYGELYSSVDLGINKMVGPINFGFFLGKPFNLNLEDNLLPDYTLGVRLRFTPLDTAENCMMFMGGI